MLALTFFLLNAAPKGPAVLPFVDEGNGKNSARVTSAFVQAAREVGLVMRTPKQLEAELGFALKPAVVECKGELVCLSQIGTTIGAGQLMVGALRGERLSIQVISVADASLVRKVEFTVGEDARAITRACKDHVFEAFGILRPGDLLLSGVPSDGLITIDGQAVESSPRISVKAGFRSLKVIGASVEPFVKELYVRPGDAIRVKVNLLPNSSVPALVEVKAPPPKEPELEEVPLVAVAPPPKPASAPAEPEPKLVEIEKKPKKKNRTLATSASQPTKLKEIVASPVAKETVVTIEKVAPLPGVRPVRIAWIVSGALTVGAVVSAGVVSVLQAQNGAAAVAEPVQLRAVQLLDAANLQTDVANALWITSGVLGAATLVLLVVDLWTAKQQSLSLSVSPSRVTLSGAF